MSSKRFRGKLCVYCGSRVSTDGDHVFAREFFLPEHRANLPKAPSCSKCNNDKSKLEHYLTTILPFAGRHSAAGRTLQSLVPPRLQRNQRLHASLEIGKGSSWHRAGGVWRKHLALPFESDTLHEWFAFVARGLLWHHYRSILPEDGEVDVYSLTPAGERHFEVIFAMHCPGRVICTLGDGTFRYTGVQVPENPLFSVWALEIFGGAVLTEGLNGEHTARLLGAFTAPNISMMDAL